MISPLPSFSMTDRENFPPLELSEPRRERVNDKLDLLIYESFESKVVVIDIIWESGAWYNRKPGVPYVLSRVMPKGTHTKKALEVAQELEKYGAWLNVETGQDFMHFNLKVLSTYLEKTLPTFMEVLNHPSLSEESIALEKAIIKSEIEHDKSSPDYIAKKRLQKAMFGSQHPYGHSLEPKDLDNISKRSLEIHYRKYKWHRPLVMATGNLGQKEIDFIKKTLEPNIPVDNLKQPIKHVIKPLKKKHYIQHISSKQASIALGNRSISYSHPDYVDLVITNFFLGGHFGSRLMQNLREQKGYTYGVWSLFSTWLHDSYLGLFADVNKDLVAESINILKKQIFLLQAHPPRQDEIDSFKMFLAGRIIDRFDNVFRLAMSYCTAHLKGLKLGYFQNLYKRVQEIEPSRVSDIARKYINIDDMYEVIVAP